MKIRKEKGITLIALIITIIILLILAVVTIGSIEESNIITYAQNASGDYKVNADEENTILDGYVSLIEESISKDKSKEAVSIVGTYGSTDYEYYKFNADGTGEHFFKPIANNELFNYTMQDNENGSITMEGGQKMLFTFKTVEYNNNEINKVVTIIYDLGTVNENAASYTTKLNAGLPEFSSDIIYENVKQKQVSGDVFFTVSFKQGKCTVKLDDGTIEDWGYYYKDGDYIFINDNMGNVFVRFFKINGNELEYL